MTLHVKPVSNQLYSNKIGGDRILITDFHVKTIVGVHDWEKKAPRDVYMSLSLGVDISQASRTDDLSQTVDYDALTQTLKVFCESANFNLIETLAESCAQIILQNFSVQDVFITLDKPGAIDCSKSVAVQIHRFK